jgi:cell division protein FtsL
MVVIPVLLMLGSVYTHTVAAGLEGRASDLRGSLDRAETEAERLGVEVSRLSAPGRIQGVAKEDLDLKDPEASDLKTYARDGEDVGRHGEERDQADPP